MRLLIHLSNTYSVWRNRFIFSKSLVPIWCLAFSCSFVEYSVLATFIEFVTDIWETESLRKAAILTNLLDGLSCLFVLLTHLLEAFTGCFSVIILSTAANVMGLMLFWIYALYIEKRHIKLEVGILIPVAGILLTALGQAGLPALYVFFEYQMKVIVRARASTTNVNHVDQPQEQIRKEEQEKDHDVRVTIWWRSARILGALLATVLPSENWSLILKRAVLAMVSSYLLFFFGYLLYAFEKSTGTPLVIIYRVFKAAFCKYELEFPGSLESYYWKNIKQNHTYKNKTGQVQLLPHVPHLWRWLDKAAIIRKPHPNPERQEMNGDLCTVKQVREVKRFVFFIHVCLTLLPYSMVVAAGNTYFVEQTSNMKSTFNTSGLFLLKSIARDMILFLFWSVKLTSQKVIKVRIGVGMAFAVICCITAFLVEHQRLSLIKQAEDDTDISMGIEILIPQFLLLGVTEALSERGLYMLFYNYVPDSMGRCDEAFINVFFGIGKLLTTPCVSIFTGWFKESLNSSHVDRYYIMLAVLNSVFIIIYGYYSTKYKEDYPEDEDLDTAEMQEIVPQARQEEAI